MPNWKTVENRNKEGERERENGHSGMQTVSLKQKSRKNYSFLKKRMGRTIRRGFSLMFILFLFLKITKDYLVLVLVGLSSILTSCNLIDERLTGKRPNRLR